MTEINMPRIAHSGGWGNSLNLVSDGQGQYPNGYELTPHGIAVVAQWLRQYWNPLDPEDCPACEVVAQGRDSEACPLHYGYAIGWEYAERNISDQMEMNK